eukprot:TRINITY_DN22500_c0_g1_i1.p2 TRINITY_DN22500_c0_g1~~TRINITY_DN22500_c0_g1_i1.p2  ORF type:complete len:306 (+),score=103.50 TRINITY_DN22500_c0_g1_i1:53-970(+)
MPGIKDKKKNRLQQGGAKRPVSVSASAGKPSGGSVWKDGTPDMSREEAQAKHLQSLQTLSAQDEVAAMPEGFCVVEDFITEEEEGVLQEYFNRAGWDADTGLGRRTQQWGYCFDYNEMTVVNEARPLPDILAPIFDRMRSIPSDGATFPFPTRPQQMIVNEYTPGQGIHPHVDRGCFGDVIATLSLGSACTLELDRGDAGGSVVVKGDMTGAPSYAVQATGAAKSKYHKAIPFPRRALILLKGPARRQWTHGIPFKTYDDFGHGRVSRGTRVSLTFRTMTKTALERLGRPAIELSKAWGGKAGGN